MGGAEKNILIGGEAGQGLATVGQLLTKTLVRAGYSIVVTQDYMSRIRGGHNTYAIRTAANDVAAPIDEIDILVAMNDETVTLHKDKLKEDGIVLLDDKLDACQLQCFKVPFKELAPKPIFENVAALGALCELLGLPRELPADLLNDTFKKKGEAIVEQNLSVLNKAYDWVKNANASFPPLPELHADEARKGHMMLNGNEAIALGALAAGVKFCSYYPMTPATSVAMNLTNLGPKMGVVVEQVEDEIAAINMGLGASYAGARTLVPTSGGGFALMVEGISLAGMMEVPIVVVLAQRPGPATGLPTRTEQGDLNLVLYAGHGEYPRAIFAPGDVEQCFTLTHRAFDQSEKHQSPAFVLTDQFLADSYRSVPPIDLNKLPEPELPGLTSDTPEEYVRYKITDSGVSPRLAPGFGPYLVVCDSDEHTEDGHITEDLDVRVRMQDKRLRKNNGLVVDIVPPDYDGEPNPDLLLVSWGSSKGPVQEAAEELRTQGQNVATLHFSQVYPLDPEHFLPALESAKKTVILEGNSTGQFANLLRQETGFAFDQKILRYDGLPFTAKTVLENL